MCLQKVSELGQLEQKDGGCTGERDWVREFSSGRIDPIGSSGPLQTLAGALSEMQSHWKVFSRGD